MTAKKPRTLLFCIMIMFYWMAMYTYQPQLTVYAGLLGAGAAFTGTILSSYGFVQMLLRVPLGLLSDFLRKRKLFAILGVVFTILSAFGMYMAKTPAALLVFRGASGVSASAWVTITVLYSSYFEGKEAPKAMSRLMAFNNAGVLIAMLAGGVIAEKFGPRSSFLLACIAGVIGLILAFGITENAPDTQKVIRAKDMLDVVCDRTLLSVSFLAMLSQIVYHGATLGFIPKFASEMGAGASDLGILSGAVTLGTLIGSWLNASYTIKRFGTRCCILAGALLYGLFTILLPILSHSVWMLYLMQLLAGFGFGLSFPLLMGVGIADIHQEKRGLAMGMFQSIYALGMFIGPILTGILIEHFSISLSISWIGCVSLLEMLLGFFLIKKQRS